MSTSGVMTMGSTATSRVDAGFEEWLHARQPALMRTAWALTGNPHDAADLLQTTLAKVYLHWGRVAAADSIDAYARRILVNEHTSWWRRAFKQREYATSTIPETAVSDRYDDGQSQRLWELVQTLSPRQRAVVVLRYYEELSEAETAEALGVSVGTVKSQCSRALTSLRDHVPTQPFAPVGLSDVKATASRIRRRRTLTGVAAAAVAAVIITPAAFLAMSGNDSATGPATPPVATPTQSPTSLPLADVTLSADAPRGSDAEGWFFEGADNAGLPADALPSSTDHVARLGDSWLISFSDEEKQERLLRLVDSTGDTVIEEWLNGADIAVSDDHDLAAFTTPDGQLRLLDDSGASRILATVPVTREIPRPIDVTGDSGCVDESSTQDCQVLLDHVDGQGPVMVTEGGLRQVDPEAEFAEAITGPLPGESVVALRDPNKPRADAPCTRVVELTGKQRWKSCDLAVDSFSPDGRWVQVVDAYQSGWGPSRIGVADAATGELFFWIEPEARDAGMGDTVWEGSEHLVTSTYDFEGQEWRLFRVSLSSGEVEQAADRVAGDDQTFPYVPPTAP